jgi:Tfp pilus assembly protein PilX
MMVFALMTLSTMALVALGTTASLVQNRRVVATQEAREHARNIAEAGIAEACSRIQHGKGPDTTGVTAARHVVQILNATSGYAGTDTTLLATGQPAGAWLDYSTPEQGPNALTIAFLTNAARTQIMHYDKTALPPVQPVSGPPIFRVIATGRAGVATCRLMVDCYLALDPMTWKPRVHVIRFQEC